MAVRRKCLELFLEGPRDFWKVIPGHSQRFYRRCITLPCSRQIQGMARVSHVPPPVGLKPEKGKQKSHPDRLAESSSQAGQALGPGLPRRQAGDIKQQLQEHLVSRSGGPEDSGCNGAKPLHLEMPSVLVPGACLGAPQTSMLT